MILTGTPAVSNAEDISYGQDVAAELKLINCTKVQHKWENHFKESAQERRVNHDRP
jgi:hypothetical protein